MTLSVALLAGLTIGLGGLVPLAGRRWHRLSALLLGVAGGAVLAIVLADVLPAAREQGTVLSAVGGVGGGAALMWLLHHVVDAHAHHGREHARAAGERVGRPGGAGRSARPAPLLAGAWRHAAVMIWVSVALHNVLDGFGIGAGFEASSHLGWAMAAAVGLHNLPVGMLVASPLVMGHVAAGRVIMATLVAGLFTPAGAVLGSTLAGVSGLAMSTCVALAGGSLLFILAGELWPLARRESLLDTLVGGSVGVALVVLLHLGRGHGGG